MQNNHSHVRLTNDGKVTRRFIIRVLSVLAFMLIVSESIARFLTNLHVVSYYKPIELVKQHEQAEELRLTHVFSGTDSEFEYDPVLFWRPKKNWGIFNELGIRGESITSKTETASSSCTILTYGDSNTVGAFQGGYYDRSWPDELSKLLQHRGISFRILNMGVSGYSSYQGLEKFRQDIDIFHPSLIIVAFGWNDASPGMKIPDKQLSTFLTPLLSPLQASRLFQVIAYYSDVAMQKFTQRSSPNEPRVSFDDFKHNLIEFITLTKKSESSVIFLTRPHADFTNVDTGNWRLRVLENNTIIREVAVLYNIPFIDMEKIFLEQYSNELRDDSHFTEEGHVIAAMVIDAFLRQNNLLCK